MKSVRPNALIKLVIVVAMTFVATNRLDGQSETKSRIWEYSPYIVNVWVAVDFSAMTPVGFADEICDRLLWSSEEVDLSGWRVNAKPAPANWRQVILDSIDDIPLPEENSDIDALLTDDKLIFVGVSYENGSYRIRAREIDCRTRIFGPVIQDESFQQSMVPHVTFKAMAAAFVPMVRIEEVNTAEGTAVARVRAAGFHTASGFGSSAPSQPATPIWVRDEDVFAPMVRRMDDTGSLVGGSVRQIDWTYLSIDRRDGVVLYCQIHSATRAPLGGRTSRLTEKVGLICRPQSTQTRLILESRDDPPIRIPGYEIHSARPGISGLDFLGKSDWDGSFILERGETPLQIVYVRSGKRPLVRLPIVPGYHEELSAAMFDDNIRRRAEGVIRGLEAEFMIVVAQRELLPTRIATALANDELEEAEQLYLELRALPSMDQFQAKLNSKARGLTSDDQREQSRITTMFAQLNGLVAQNMARDVVIPVREEIDRYKANNNFGEGSDSSNTDNSGNSGFGTGNSGGFGSGTGSDN